MTYLRAKFHLPISCGSLLIAIKQKAEQADVAFNSQS
jgi:hypothetical protein